MINNNDVRKRRIFITLFLIVFASLFLTSEVYSGNNDQNDTNQTQCDNYMGETFCAGSSCYSTDWYWDDSLPNIDGSYYIACCGDDDNENFAYFDAYDPNNNCNDIISNDCVGQGDDASDANCCDSSNDCVLNGYCYSDADGYSQEIDIDGDGVYGEYCTVGTWRDCDSSQPACQASYCGNREWIISGESSIHGEYNDLVSEECCGDDSGEYNLSRRAGSSFTGISSDNSDKACCDSQEDCIFNNVCYDDNSSFDVDSDGDNDYCGSGEWFDCSIDSHCSSGFNCSNNICVNENIPDKPVLWTGLELTSSSSADIIGYSNESVANVTIDVLSSSLEVVHYNENISLNSTLIGSALTATSKTRGTNKISVPDSAENKLNFAEGNFIDFANHDKEYLLRYHINRQDDIGDSLQLNLSGNLEQDVPSGVKVWSYDTLHPTGWFNISISLFTGNNNISVQVIDSLGNEGLASYITIFYDTEDPKINTSEINSPTNNADLDFIVSDNYEANISTLNINVTNASSTYRYYYDSNITCYKLGNSYQCTIEFLQEQGTYNLFFSVNDLIGRNNISTISDFIYDSSPGTIASVTDSGELTNSKVLNATWTDMQESLSETDYYEYCIGTSSYPSSGYNSIVSWTQTNFTNISAGPLDLMHGSEYFFNVRGKNTAGSYSNVISSDGIIYIDNTPASISYIYDSGDYTGSDSELALRWNASDPESEITEYELIVGTAPYPEENWYGVHSETIDGIYNQTVLDVSLSHNQIYYATIRAKNGYGDWSQRKSTDGITVDTTPPRNGWLNYSKSSPNSNEINLKFSQGSDPESGIWKAELWYAAVDYENGECSGTYLYNNFIIDVTSQNEYDYTAINGRCYRFQLRVYNYANLTTEYYYFENVVNGTVELDTTPPLGFNVTDDGAVTNNGTKLHARWNRTTDPESEISHFEYRIRYSFNSGSLIQAVPWTDVGDNISATHYFNLNHSNLTHQYKYFFEVKAVNSANVTRTETSNGILYMDIYPPNTNLINVGRDTTTPYKDYTFRNISINVSGEKDMRCVYSQEDIDYSDSADSCTTTGNISVCTIEILSSGNYTYHIVCEDVYGNGQDFQENLDINFESIVVTPVTQTISVGSDEKIFVDYLLASGEIYLKTFSDTQIQEELAREFNYDIIFKNNASTFFLKMSDVDIDNNLNLDINGSYHDLSGIDNLNRDIGSSRRYKPKLAYAFEINGEDYSSDYVITLNYSSVSISNDNAVLVYKFGYDFSDNEISYSDYDLLYYELDNNKDLATVNFSVSENSIYVLVEDSQMPEICNDNIDNDGDGKIDEGCQSQSPGGGVDDDDPGGGSGSSGGSWADSDETETEQDNNYITDKDWKFGTCYDNLKNQDETDVDCGGICAENDLTKKCDDDKTCRTSFDCLSGKCHPEKKICYTPTCNDNEKNQGEEDVDCGGPCRPCPTCDDGLKNQGETGIDCGGPCDACPTCFDGILNQDEVEIDCGGVCKVCPSQESPGIASLLPLVIFGIILVGGAFTGMLIIKKHKSKSKPIYTPQKSISEPKKPVEPEPFEMTGAMLMKLLNYSNFLIKNDISQKDIRTKLLNLGWPEQAVDATMQNLGNPDYIQHLHELDEYISNNLDGLKTNEIKEKLKMSKWDDIDVDLVLSNAHNIEDVSSIKKFINYELIKSENDSKIKNVLCNAGWPEKIVEKELLAQKNSVKKDRAMIEYSVLNLFEQGKSRQKIKKILKNKGFNMDIVDLVMLDKFDKDKNIEKIRNFVNMRLLKGDSVDEIKKTLINAEWSIDVIDRIIHDNFRKNDLKYLIALDSYIKRAFEKGYTKKILTNKLLKSNWAEEYIDMVMLKVHIVDDKLDKVKKYINLRLEKGDSRKKITNLLVKVGWARNVVKDIFENK
ncbi:hypothetical protein GF327_04105 [Candidatus Woesearchaeota archaeon]|nr:hypothetical protein [Candidatus Woesearchaeota archaeon]